MKDQTAKLNAHSGNATRRRIQYGGFNRKVKGYSMKTSELVFIGIKGSVLALNRSTGEQVWATRLKGFDFVNVVVESERVFATCNGEIFCLDPLTGEELWHNRLKGFGMGLATIATEDTTQNAATPTLAEKRRRVEEAASTTAATA